MSRLILGLCLISLCALEPSSARAQTNDLGGLVDRLTGADRNPDEDRIDAASDKAIADPGRTVRWRNPETGHSGTVRVTGAFRSDDGYDCLNYRRVTATDSGRIAHEGAFCRQIFGWTRASERQVSTTARRHAADSPSQADSEVRRVQTLLSAVGYEPGPADGLYGPRTRAAIRAYQGDRGLQVDGRATAALADRLERDGAQAEPVPPPAETATARHAADPGRAEEKIDVEAERSSHANASQRPVFPYPGTALPHSPLPRQQIASAPDEDIPPPHDRLAPPLDGAKTAHKAESSEPNDPVEPLRPGLLVVMELPSSPVEASLARLEETDACAGCTLREADLTGFELAKADLADADLSGSVLEGIWADFADLRRADLSGARLRDAQLWKARLARADLRGAVLDGTDLVGADLAGADLRHATLRDADLRGADLAGARVDGADFRGARLSRADLTDVDLSSASVTAEALDNAVLCGTVVSGREVDTGCGAQTVEVSSPPEIVAGPGEPDAAEGRR